MTLSICVFLFGGFIMYVILNQALIAEKVHDKKQSKLYIIYAVIFFSLLSGMRYNYGGDCESYAQTYLLTEKNGVYTNPVPTENPEPLFASFAVVFSKLAVGRVVYMSFLAFLQIYFLLKSLENHKYLLPMAGVTIFMGALYGMLMAAIRQMIVACMFFYAIFQLVEKKNVKRYLLMVLIGYFIHKSALMLLPFVFVYKIDRIPSKRICIFLFLLSVFLGSSNFLTNYLVQIEFVMSALNYNQYAEGIENLAQLDSEITTFGPRQMLLLVNYVFVIWYSNKIDRWLHGNKLWRVCFVLFLFYVCLMELLRVTSGIFTRPLLYFMPFLMICTTYLLVYLKEAKQFAVFCLVLFVSCSFNIFASIIEANVPDSVLQFRFVFMQ